MSEIQMIRLNPEAKKALGFHPDLLLPVREERVREIFPGGEVQLGALVEELDEIVKLRPDLRDSLKDEVARLAFFEGVKLGDEGLHEIAARFFALGLSYDPDSLSLRLNLAMAYHLAGRLEDAVTQYVEVLDDPQVGVSPVIVMQAAHACVELGDGVLAETILQSAEHAMFEDDAYWELRATAKEMAGLSPKRERGASEPARNIVLAMLAEGGGQDYIVCPTCLATLEPGGGLCPECGQETGGGLSPTNRESRLPVTVIPGYQGATTPPAEAVAPSMVPCPNCSAQIKAEARFCGKCGKPTTPPAPPAQAAPRFCGKCGNPLAAGKKFCGKCGNPVGGV